MLYILCGRNTQDKDPIISWKQFSLLVGIFLSFAASAADINDQLRDAALIGSTEEAQHLLEKGADANFSNKYGKSVLMFASEEGNTDIVKLLLKAGANVNASSAVGCTALTQAAEGGHVEIVRVLLDSGANTAHKTRVGWDGLMIASRYGFSDVLEVLIASKASVNTSDKDGNTALMAAVEKGHLPVARLLLAAKADVLAQNKNGENALMIAAGHGHIEILELLLSSGARINVADVEGATALMWAVEKDYIHTVEYLALAVRTDPDGRFVIPGLAPGSYVLVASAEGYRAQERAVELRNPADSAEVSFSLETLASFAGDVVVEPSRYTLYQEAPAVRASLSREEVERMPHFADDVFRAVHWLPGTTGEDMSSTMNVRGGVADESLILLDGVEIYEGFHLKELFSVTSIIDAEAVEDLEFRSGGYPVQYGNRMSGVVDIRSASPMANRLSFGVSTTNISLLSGASSRAGARNGWSRPGAPTSSLIKTPFCIEVNSSSVVAEELFTYTQRLSRQSMHANTM